MRYLRICVFVVVLGAQFPAVSLPQHDGRKEAPHGSGNAPVQLPATNIPDLPTRVSEEDSGRRTRANKERHAQTMADATRLAQLSRELERDLESSGSESLPVSASRKADEIIKLAKSLKQKIQTF